MRTRVLLVPVVIAAALLGGCAPIVPAETRTSAATPTPNGVAALAARAILTESIVALQEASSFRLRGSAIYNGGPIGFDAVLVGADVDGTLTVAGISAEFIRVGGTSYLRSEPFLRGIFFSVKDTSKRDQALTAARGKYVKLPDDDLSDRFMPSIAELLEAKGGVNALQKGEATAIDGRPAITLIYGTGARLFVATTGEPYPLQLVANTGQKLDVVEVGASVSITAPAASEVVDFATLVKLLGG